MLVDHGYTAQHGTDNAEKSLVRSCQKEVVVAEYCHPLIFKGLP